MSSGSRFGVGGWSWIQSKGCLSTMRSKECSLSWLRAGLLFSDFRASPRGIKVSLKLTWLVPKVKWLHFIWGRWLRPWRVALLTHPMWHCDLVEGGRVQGPGLCKGERRQHWVSDSRTESRFGAHHQERWCWNPYSFIHLCKNLEGNSKCKSLESNPNPNPLTSTTWKEHLF